MVRTVEVADWELQITLWIINFWSLFRRTRVKWTSEWEFHENYIAKSLFLLFTIGHIGPALVGFERRGRRQPSYAHCSSSHVNQNAHTYAIWYSSRYQCIGGMEIYRRSIRTGSVVWNPSFRLPQRNEWLTRLFSKNVRAHIISTCLAENSTFSYAISIRVNVVCLSFDNRREYFWNHNSGLLPRSI